MTGPYTRANYTIPANAIIVITGAGAAVDANGLVTTSMGGAGVPTKWLMAQVTSAPAGIEGSVGWFVNPTQSFSGSIGWLKVWASTGSASGATISYMAVAMFGSVQ